MKKLLILFLQILFLNLFSQNSKENIYHLSSLPSFNKMFEILIYKEKNELEFHIINGNYISEENNFKRTVVIDEKLKKIIIKNIDKLSKCKNKKKLRGLDGITLFVSNNISSCEYWSPNEKSKNGKSFLEIFSSLILIFKDDIFIKKIVEDSKNYITN